MFCFKIISGTKHNSLINLLSFLVILCSLNGLQTIATVETMNFRIPCFLKILQPPLGWQNLGRTIAYTRFHRIKGGGGVPLPPPPISLIEWMKFKDFMNPALCDAGGRIHKISSTLSKVIGDRGGGGGGTPPFIL